MSIEENIARNAALRENLFMMFVCIQLRIPLFLVGKPGSSKSLAKTIIQNSMRGQNSKNKTLRQFNHVILYNSRIQVTSSNFRFIFIPISAVNYLLQVASRMYFTLLLNIKKRGEKMTVLLYQLLY